MCKLLIAVIISFISFIWASRVLTLESAASSPPPVVIINVGRGGKLLADGVDELIMNCQPEIVAARV
jgi:hypothetical protein